MTAPVLREPARAARGCDARILRLSRRRWRECVAHQERPAWSVMVEVRLFGKTWQVARSGLTDFGWSGAPIDAMERLRSRLKGATMSGDEVDREISRFFDAFVEAFARFDGKAVGSFFITPGVALKRDGSLQGFPVQQDVEAYYQAALDHYRASGCRACRYAKLETSFLNERSVIATASWDLLRGDGSVISHWRQAYFLARFGDTWRAYGSAFVSA